MGTLLEVAQGHRIEEDNTIMLSFGVSSALLVVSSVLVALLEHSELAVNSFRDLISILEQCVPCQLEVLKIMGKYHVQLQSLTHFKLLMELQEIFPHFRNDVMCSFNISSS